MTQEEIKALTEAVTKGGDTLTNYIKGLKPTEPVISLDGVKKFLAEDENGKTYLQSTTDKKVTDGINTAIENFKKEKMPGLIDDEIKKRYPDADPKDTKIAELEAKYEQMQKDAARKDLTNKALQAMTEKKLPTDLVNFIVGEDENTTKANLETLTGVLSKHDEALKTEILKDTYKPGGKGGAEQTEEAVQAQVNSIFGLKQ